jgi:hypothetical protein
MSAPPVTLHPRLWPMAGVFFPLMLCFLLLGGAVRPHSADAAPYNPPQPFIEATALIREYDGGSCPVTHPETGIWEVNLNTCSRNPAIVAHGFQMQGVCLANGQDSQPASNDVWECEFSFDDAVNYAGRARCYFQLGGPNRQTGTWLSYLNRDGTEVEGHQATLQACAELARGGPDTIIDSGPSFRTLSDLKPTFGFHSSATPATFECRFDTESFASCSGPGAEHTSPIDLSKGSHTFAVRAIDVAGRVDPSPAVREFTVGENRPPIAKPDQWSVRPGRTVDETVLDNDSDPDGDAITAHVLQISFAHREWSGMDPDGGFLYTAGPGTIKTFKKKITYVAVDSKGAKSTPVTAVVKIKPFGHRAKSPTSHREATLSVAASTHWEGPWAWARSCFKTGIHTLCFTMDSVQRTGELARSSGWGDSLEEATKFCLKYGLLPMTNEACAKKLLGHAGGFIDKAILKETAKLGECLLTLTRRHRSLLHPLAGVWGKPTYAFVESGVVPYSTEAPNTTGWGTWSHGLTGKYRVPLSCSSSGEVFQLVNGELAEIG